MKRAINSLAFSVIYSFNVLKQNKSEIRKIDRNIRKLLTCNNMPNSKVDAGRYYLPRTQRSRDLIQFQISYQTITIRLAKYIETSNNVMLKLVEN